MHVGDIVDGLIGGTPVASLGPVAAAIAIGAAAGQLLGAERKVAGVCTALALDQVHGLDGGGGSKRPARACSGSNGVNESVSQNRAEIGLFFQYERPQASS